MSTLLLQIHGNKYLNRVMFPPYLEIYTDFIRFYQRVFISTQESTITYPHIVKVVLSNGIIFSNIELVSASGAKEDNIYINWVGKKKAKLAKKIIDQKIHEAHHKSENGEPITHVHKDINDYERALHKLEELHKADRIDYGVYKKQKGILLKKLR